MSADLEGMLDEAEQLDEEAAKILAESDNQRHRKRQTMQHEAAQLKKVAKGIRNEANSMRQVAWERIFVSQAARILSPSQFEMIKAAADVHHRGTTAQDPK